MKLFKLRILLVLIALLYFQSLSAQGYIININYDSNKMYRPNVAITDTTFANYLKRLNYAIDHKNTKALLALMDSNIKCSFGAEGGWSGFINMWHPDKENTVWLLLRKLLSIGGTYDSSRTRWVYPYVVTLPDYYDPFYSFVITGKDIKLMAKPDKQCTVVTTLSFDIVSQHAADDSIKTPKKKLPLNPLGGWEWYYIHTIDNKYSGYVYWESIWNPVDYRFFLEKTDGKWSMNCFVGGD